MSIWFGQIHTRRGIINDEVFIKQNKEFKNAFGIPESNIKFSNGWLYKYKYRHGLCLTTFMVKQVM